MKKGFFIFLVFMLVLAGCKKNESAVSDQHSLEAVREKAALLPVERELIIEKEQFRYGNLQIELPNGVSVQSVDSPTKGLAVDFYGLEKDSYWEGPNDLEPRIWLSSYQIEYENKEALITAILEKTGGSAVFNRCQEEEQEFYGEVYGQYTNYYFFIRGKEVYFVEFLKWDEDYAFPWLLNERRQVYWADEDEPILYSEDEESLVYHLLSHEAEDILMVYTYYEHTCKLSFYEKGFYHTPLQKIFLSHDHSPHANLMKDWDFDGYTDLVLGDRIWLWNREKKKFLPSKAYSFAFNADSLRIEISTQDAYLLQRAVLWEETKTIWTARTVLEGSIHNDLERLWQWEENRLVKRRECREREEEGMLYLSAYDYAAGEVLFDVVLSQESDDYSSRRKELYQSFYAGMVPDTFYSLEHTDKVEAKYIPEDLMNLLEKALEKETEQKTLSSMRNERELSDEEAFALAREYPHVRMLFTPNPEQFYFLEADVDNDGIKDILMWIHTGGEFQTTYSLFYQGQPDGSYKEISSFSPYQEFGILSFEGKNYLYQKEYDYAQKLYSGLSISYYEDGVCREEVHLNLEEIQK